VSKAIRSYRTGRRIAFPSASLSAIVQNLATHNYSHWTSDLPIGFQSRRLSFTRIFADYLGHSR